MIELKYEFYSIQLKLSCILKLCVKLKPHFKRITEDCTNYVDDQFLNAAMGINKFMYFIVYQKKTFTPITTFHAFYEIEMMMVRYFHINSNLKNKFFIFSSIHFAENLHCKKNSFVFDDMIIKKCSEAELLKKVSSYGAHHNR